jgi:hypothetical protein
MTQPQSFHNHVRWFPLVHFVLTPILFFNLIWQVVRLSQDRTWDRAEDVLVAVALMILSLAARLQALRAQDRVVRLEERLRYKELLPADLAAQAGELKLGQIIALRFAPDEELPELVKRTLAGEFGSNKDIKLAVKNWRGDYLRV